MSFTDISVCLSVTKLKISDRHYISHKFFQKVPECSSWSSSWKSVTYITLVTSLCRMFQNVQVEVKVENQWQTLHLSQVVPDNSRKFQNVPECSRMFQKVCLSSSWKSVTDITLVTSLSRMFQNVLECSRRFQKVPALMLSQSLLPRYGLSSSMNLKSIFYPYLDPISQYPLWLHLYIIIDISSLPYAHAPIPMWWQRCDSNSNVLEKRKTASEERFNENMKSTVTDRNVTNSKENENCQVVSQLQSLLSNVEEALSSVCVKMSSVNVEARKKILPNVSQILYQVECIVSSSSQPLDIATDLCWDESGVHLEESYGQDDSLLSDVFLFSDARSSTSPFRSLSTSLSSRYSSA